VDAAEQTPPKLALENVFERVSTLPADRIVAWVDLDDWLATDHALATVARVYEDPECWMTYGSYVCADGRRGIASPLTHDDFRGGPWIYSHLKTFRAGLFQKIALQDMQVDGRWISLAIDLCLMFPMLEMSGAAHVRFCPEVLYVYNYAASYEHNATTAALLAEHEQARHLRSLPRYRRLGARPW
jgi:hypothetical protein